MLMSIEVLSGEVVGAAVLDKNLPELSEARRQRFTDLLVKSKVLAGSRIVIVIFESRAREGVVIPNFHEKDLLAAEAAEKSGGLIIYNPEPGESVCLWETPEQMKLGTNTNEHREAAKLAPLAYESWRVSQWEVNVLTDGGEVDAVPVSLMGYDGTVRYHTLYENGLPVLAA